MNRIRRAGAATVAAALLLCYGAAARAEGVLDQVPSDAWVVVRVNRLEQTNKKAAAWAEAMGIAQLSPDAADPLGALERKMNVKGLDKSKDMAIVMLDPAKSGGNEDKSVLVLVPTTDYKAMSASLPGAKAEGEITTFTPEGESEPSYVANWGNYAAISPTQALVSKKPGGIKIAGLAAKEMQDKDAVVYVNIPAMRETLLPKLKKLREQTQKQMRQQFNGAGANANGAGDDAANGAAPSDTPAARPRPRPKPAQPRTPGAGGTGTGPSSRAGDDANADVALAALQQQPSRQPGQRPAPSRQPARRPQSTTPGDADTTDADSPAASGRRPGRRPGAGGDPTAAMMKQYGPAMSTLVDQYFNIAERFLTEANAATFSLNLTDQGLNPALMVEFAPGSYLGKIASGMKNTDASLLAGLPGERKYFAFGGFNVSPEPFNQLVTDYVDPVLKQLGGAGAGGQNVQQLADAVRRSIQNTKTTAIGYPAAAGPLGTESVFQQVVVTTGNAKEIAAAQKQILQGMSSLMQGIPKGAAAGAPAAPQISLDLKEGAKTVGNVKLDEYKMNMQMDQDSPQGAQAQQMMAMMYGPNGLSGVMGAVNDRTFVAVQGGTDQLVQQVVTGAQNPQDVLSRSAPVQAAGKQLPQNRFGVFYVQLDQIITSGVKYAQGFGVPVKMKLPENLPPLGFAAASEGTALRLDIHIPTNTVQSIVAAGMQAYMQMQGGGGQPGAPEGL